MTPTSQNLTPRARGRPSAQRRTAPLRPRSPRGDRRSAKEATRHATQGRLTLMHHHALDDVAGSDDRNLRRHNDHVGETTANHAELGEPDRRSSQLLGRNRAGRGVSRVGSGSRATFELCPLFVCSTVTLPTELLHSRELAVCATSRQHRIVMYMLHHGPAPRCGLSCALLRRN